MNVLSCELLWAKSIKHFGDYGCPFRPRDIRKNPRNMYARVPQAIVQFVLKIERLSHIMGTTPIVELARAYGLHPRLWLLVSRNTPVESLAQSTAGRVTKFSIYFIYYSSPKVPNFQKLVKSRCLQS